MSDAIYFGRKGINASLLKKVKSSPADGYAAQYGESKDPTPSMVRGTAYHTLFLQGKRAFGQRYAIPFDPSDYPDALDTVDDLKNQCKEYDLIVKGKKVDYINALLDAGFPREKILQCIKDDHFSNIGEKIILPPETYEQVLRDYAIFRNQSQFKNLFEGGKSEVVAICQPSIPGLHEKPYQQPYKAKIDYITKDGWIIDIKTISTQNKDFKDACIKEIINRKYHIQAIWYLSTLQSAIKQMKTLPKWSPTKVKGFKFLFIRADGTPDFLLMDFNQNNADGHINMFWRKAINDTHHALLELERLQKQFGKRKRWLTDEAITLSDDHFPNYFLQED